MATQPANHLPLGVVTLKGYNRKQRHQLFALRYSRHYAYRAESPNRSYLLLTQRQNAPAWLVHFIVGNAQGVPRFPHDKSIPYSYISDFHLVMSSQ